LARLLKYSPRTMGFPVLDTIQEVCMKNVEEFDWLSVCYLTNEDDPKNLMNNGWLQDRREALKRKLIFNAIGFSPKKSCLFSNLQFGE